MSTTSPHHWLSLRLPRKPFSVLIAVCVLTIGMGATFAEQEAKAIDPCALLSNVEATAAIGELKGDAASKDGLRGKKCNYNNMKGGWVSIEVYSADAHWDLMKNLALDVQPLSGLGDEAFSAKRGDTRQVYVKKGSFMIEVDSSAGMDAAQKFAAMAAKRLP